LRFVDYEQHAFPLLNASPEVSLQTPEKPRFADPLIGNPIARGHHAQQIECLHLGCDDMSRDDVLLGEELKQRVHEQCLSRTHIARDDNESFALLEAVAEIRERPFVTLTVEKESRIRAQSEGLGFEIVKSFVHVRSTY
jgi:hypothetical protein